jgi:hypothetical protein
MIDPGSAILIALVVGLLGFVAGMWVALRWVIAKLDRILKTLEPFLS